MTLLELAEKVEGLTSPCREVFEDAFRLVFPKPSRIWVTDSTGDYTPEYEAWQGRQHAYWDYLEVGAFLDAAMLLVPSSERAWNVRIVRDDDTWGAAVWHPFDSPPDIGPQFCTPALALVAACLRSRSEHHS